MKNNPNLENNRWVHQHGFSAGKHTLYKGRTITMILRLSHEARLDTPLIRIPPNSKGEAFTF